MNWPTSQDYNEAIQNAATSVSDPDLKSGEATVNAMGLPVPRSGNFADVYQFKDGSSASPGASRACNASPLSVATPRQVHGLRESEKHRVTGRQSNSGWNAARQRVGLPRLLLDF